MTCYGETTINISVYVVKKKLVDFLSNIKCYIQNTLFPIVRGIFKQSKM